MSLAAAVIRMDARRLRLMIENRIADQGRVPVACRLEDGLSHIQVEGRIPDWMSTGR